MKEVLEIYIFMAIGLFLGSLFIFFLQTGEFIWDWALVIALFWPLSTPLITGAWVYFRFFAA